MGGFHQNLDIVGDSTMSESSEERAKAVADYTKKLLDHRDLEVRVKKCTFASIDL